MTEGRRLELAWSEHQGRSCLRVGGWTGVEFRELGNLGTGNIVRRLAVVPSEFIEAGGDFHAAQPMAGQFEIDEATICFIPRFPLLDGMCYSLLVDSALVGRGLDSLEVWTIERPTSKDTPTTDVVAIYPTADELPVNQLKLYIHFSGPMSVDWAVRAVQIRRADNDEPLDGVFLSMEPELWDSRRRRLTLLLDPGRIKRGLVPHEEAGYPLIEGVPVIVTIATEFRDAAGRPLRTGAERTYEIGPPVRVRVSPADWRHHCPTTGSTDPLTVEFDRPLDHALLQQSLRVNDPAGSALSGQVSVGPGERCWRFEPQSPWEEGQHQLTVDPRLEDLAGNSLIRVFDRDLKRTEDAPINAGHVAIDFTCTSKLPRTKLTS
jgi:hypothetical protein